jgi:RNA polymerase sigma-70 factor (ECF subfamily)
VNVASSTDADDPGQLVAAWFEAYQAPLFRYLLRLMSDEQHAADLLQDTFLQAFAALSRQAPPTNPFAWLYRIATNNAYNALRRRKRWGWLALSGREHTSGFESAIATAQIVRRCLLRLRSAEAEALLLYEWAGLTCVEIAVLTGEQPPAIRMRICRARARFCDYYEREVANDM